MSCEGLSFEECELVILRLAMDNAEKKNKIKLHTPETEKIINIVAKFIKDKKLICYGGTAINNILPEKDRFYDEDIDIPDYDFFSTTPIEDAIELTNIYYNKGFEVEAKSGQHVGTYKVFVNFMPIADITYLKKDIFDFMLPRCIVKKHILYAPPNFLRMSMFSELSRPDGDISRWEKVLKRLILLNRHYPIAYKPCNYNFQRHLVSNKKLTDILYNYLLDIFIDNNVVFFGSYALSLYSEYSKYKIINKQPDFDVISVEANSLAYKVKKILAGKGIEIKVIKHPQIEEFVGEHYELRIGVDTIAFIYIPLACHSYNKIIMDGRKLNVATIDTMLSFFLVFLYLDKPYYNITRIVCMCQYLFNIQQKNRLKQKGLLKRFNVDCIGKQKTLEELKEEKSLIYEKLKKNKNDPLFQKYFFRYKPQSDTLDSSNTFVNNFTEYKSTISKSKSSHTKPSTHKINKHKKKGTRKSSIFNWLRY